MKTSAPNMSIKDKIAAANEARDAAALPAAEAAEFSDLEALFRAQAEQVDAEEKKRDLALMKRLVAAQEIHGADKVRAVAVKGSAHTFVVKGNQEAHAKWELKFGQSLTNKKISKADIDREYAVACVADWDGKTDFGSTTVNGYELDKFLKTNSGIVSPILGSAMLLNNFLAEEAKS